MTPETRSGNRLLASGFNLSEAHITTLAKLIQAEVLRAIEADMGKGVQLPYFGEVNKLGGRIRLAISAFDTHRTQYIASLLDQLVDLNSRIVRPIFIERQPHGQAQPPLFPFAGAPDTVDPGFGAGPGDAPD